MKRKKRVRPVPDDMSGVIPRLFCRDPLAELKFCRRAFGAEEWVRRFGPDGRVAHVLIAIGAANVMIESEWPSFANRAPRKDGSSPVAIFIYVEDVDVALKRAVAGGAKVIRAAENQIWGDRIGWIMDPAGHVWTVASRVEHTTEKQRLERIAKLRAGLPWQS